MKIGIREDITKQTLEIIPKKMQGLLKGTSTKLDVLNKMIQNKIRVHEKISFRNPGD